MVPFKKQLVTIVHHNWHIEELYINNAFLYGDLYENVYVEVPQGYISSFHLIYQAQRLLWPKVS